MDKKSAILASLLVAVGLSIGIFFALTRSHECEIGAVGGSIGGPFELTNQFGQRVTQDDVITGPSFVYFGYTFCPDACPLDVGRMVTAVELLEEDGLKVTPVFFTIDPARDTVEALSDYAEVMHPRMVALTGTESEVKAAADAYRIYYRKANDDPDYLMDHTTFTYLMDQNGFLTFFRRDETALELKQKAACLLR